MPVDALAAGMERELSGIRIPVAERGTRFHLAVDDAIVEEAGFDHVRGLFERRVDRRRIAHLRVERQVARAVVPHPRRVRFEGGKCVRHRGKRFVIDGDEIRRIAGLRCSRCDDDGDDLADVARLVAQDRRLRRVERCRAVAIDEGGVLPVDGARRIGDVRQIANAVSDVIGSGQNRDDARSGFRRGGIDGADFGVGMRRADHRGMELARQVDVVGIFASAAQQAQILASAQRCADAGVRSAVGAHARRRARTDRRPVRLRPARLAQHVERAHHFAPVA